MVITATLLTALSSPAIAAMSDADAATALSTPTYTPRAEPITLTTLSGAAVWGFAKTAAFRSALTMASGNADPNISAPAATLLSILSGPGFYATDPQVAQMVPTFVALGGGTITEADGMIAVGVPAYPAGTPVTTTDVTAARGVLPAYQAAQHLARFGSWLLNEALAPGGTGIVSQILAGTLTTAPGLDALWTQFNAGN